MIPKMLTTHAAFFYETELFDIVYDPYANPIADAHLEHMGHRVCIFNIILI